MKRAEHPFQFVTAAYLTRISNHSAVTLGEWRDNLEKCSDASVFYHTFQSLQRHHFLTASFANDFAQWVLAALNREELAEQLGALDLRGYTELRDLRADMLRVTDDFLRVHPHELTRPAFEPFNFEESVEVTIPQNEVWTLEDFRKGLEALSKASFHFHFLFSRLRLHLGTNDFSLWFAGELGLAGLAQRTNRIDIYSNTIEESRAKLVGFIDRELAA